MLISNEERNNMIKIFGEEAIKNLEIAESPNSSAEEKEHAKFWLHRKVLLTFKEMIEEDLKGTRDLKKFIEENESKKSEKERIRKARRLKQGLEDSLYTFGKTIIDHLVEFEKVAKVKDLAAIIQKEPERLRELAKNFDEKRDESLFMFLIYTEGAEGEKNPLARSVHHYLLTRAESDPEFQKVFLNKLDEVEKGEKRAHLELIKK
jgi:hypothetical protein